MLLPNLLRLEKEKGRELTKAEVKTTMKALVMMNKSKFQNSVKKKKIGENGEEIEVDSDEEGADGFKKRSFKGNLFSEFNIFTLISQTNTALL